MSIGPLVETQNDSLSAANPPLAPCNVASLEVMLSAGSVVDVGKPVAVPLMVVQSPDLDPPW